MVKRVALMVAVLFLSTVAVQAADWNVDKAHSSISFKVRHLVISKTKGEFTDFDGKVSWDGKDLSTGNANFTIQVNSVDTDNEDRDNHLKSPDFFDAEKYPTMTFATKKIIPGDGDNFQIVGDLTIKDVTKEVTFDGEFHGIVEKDPWGMTRSGFSLETTIDRQEFNIAFSKAMETGGLVVGNEVEISMELELIKAK